VDQATSAEVGEQVHVGPNRTARSRPRIHYVAAVSSGEATTVAGCQQLFADFAVQTTDAPLYSELATGIADDPQLAELILAAPVQQRLPVLLFASVHWLLLADPADPLARYYPNLARGAVLPPDEALGAFRAFCLERAADLAGLLATRRTQTNEVGRTALFVPTLARLGATLGDLAHVDVGASAGLNLLIDRYDFRYEPGGALRCGSTVTITCATRGNVPVPDTYPPISATIGIDANPLDVRDPAQARWLEACVWPDHVDRFQRLVGAIEIAREGDVDVRQGDAITSIGATASEAAQSGHPVVTTSWVMNYFTSAGRFEFLTELERAAATVDISWLYAESPALCPDLPGMPPPRRGAKQPTALVLVRWRGGHLDAHHVADAHPHGRWLHWL
jgi:hypothetical protein